jgi:hypothetical protein
VVTDFLIDQANWKKPRACSWVSEKLHRHGFTKADGKPITRATVAEWRDEVMNAPRENPQWLLFKELRQSLAEQRTARWLWATTSQDGILTSPPAHEVIATRFLAEFERLMPGIRNPENPTPFSDSD